MTTYNWSASETFEWRDGQLHCVECDWWVPEGMDYLAFDHSCYPFTYENGFCKCDNCEWMVPEDLGYLSVEHDCSDYEHLDQSEVPPVIDGRRISMLDFEAALRQENPQEQFEYWDLSDEQIREAKRYIKEHKHYLDELE